MRNVRSRSRRPLAVWVVIGIAAGLAVLVSAFVGWASLPARPMPAALEALSSDDRVRVDTDGWLTFLPMDEEPTVGLIIYPGGRVDARAYAPLAREIASEGNLVVVVPMPLNLAFLGWRRADGVIAEHPGIATWVVAGHSLGGAFAAQYASERSSVVDGLVLWAAYPAENNDLSQYEGAVYSIHATEDGLATPEEIAASRARLPAATCWVAIEGGNHAQFGSYGRQAGDNPASISRASQRRQIASATEAALARANGERDWQPYCE